jgi:protein LTV1
LEAYNSGDEEESVTSAAPAQGNRQFKEERADFDAIMDEFLGGYKVLGKKMVKKTNGVSGGMAELDEVRKELGRARIS